MEDALEMARSKDTKERMAGVERLHQVLEASRKSLSSSEVTSLVDTCLDLLKDNNFKVSQGALLSLSSAAVLSGELFKLHFNAIVPAVVDRLGDGKQPVRDSARRLLLTLMEVSSPTLIVERAGSYAWMHKSWRIREEFARTVTSAIGLFASTELPLQRAILPSILQMLNDSHPGVREAAIVCIEGRNVVLEQSYGAPKVTKDGVTVAKSIEFKDRVKNVGASLVKQVANATNDVAGDGTTCATILTRAIYSEGCKSVAAGMNAMDLRRGINMAVDAVVTNLKSRARMISTSEEIAQVGTISANGDREIGELIAKAMEKVGKEGVITIADGKTLYNELEVVEGMKLDRGYISPYFVTNPKNQKCELDDPLILIHEKKISNLNAVVKVLELALKKQRPLLIVSEDVESEALATLILNKLRAGIKVCAIKAPGFGENRKASLQDLAVLTGGTVITDELGMTLEKVGIEMLGSCKKVTISKDDTVILDGAGDKKAIEERCEQVRSSIELSTSDYDKEKHQDRLAKLSGGVAVLKIGGASEVEVGEKKDRVTDALNATKAAVEEGIVPGGGVALLYASKELDNLHAANFDQKIGIQIIQSALKAPVHTIVSNAGVEGAVVVGKLLEQDDPDLGYDAAKGEYVDMVKAGIIDPLKVIRTALVDAASVSSLLTTTEAVIVELPNDDKEMSAAGGGMGGMGGMGF